MDTIIFTRDELYELVWKEPIQTLALRYEISATELRKACITLSVPIPKVGYWQKLKFNKQVSRPKLEATSGPIDVSIKRTNNAKPFNQRIEEISKSRNTSHEIKPDKLVVETGRYLKSRDRYIDRGLVNGWGDVLAIRVSKENIDRALQFYNMLIQLLRTSGHSIVIENRETIAIINEERFKIYLREKLKRIEVPGRSDWNKYDYIPTGLFVFQWDYFLGKQWNDGRISLEEQIPKIIAWFEGQSKKIKEQRETSRLAQERLEIERRSEESRKKKIDDELAKFKALLEKAKRYQSTLILRKYINDLNKQTISERVDELDFNEWLSWANSMIDWYDPTIENEIDLLKDVDKQTLTLKQKSWY